MKRRIIWLGVLMILILIMSGCSQTKQPGGQADSSQKGSSQSTNSRVIRIGMTTAPDSHYVKGSEFFAKRLKELTGGQLEVQIFHSSQLGNERDLIEGLSMGTVEMAITSSAPIVNFSKSFMVFDLPFIVESREKLFSFADGPKGKAILDTLLPKGIVALGFWENGFRHITNSKKQIIKPEDVKGLKIRTMENPVHLETFKTLGAIATPMAWGEVFTALQQGVIDGQENPLVIIETAKVYEVQKYISLTGHFYSPAVAMVSKKFWDSLSKEQQEAIVQAEKEARNWERNYCIELDKNLAEKLKERGMVVTEVDRKEWAKAVESIYSKFEAEIGKENIEALRGGS